MNRKQLFHGTNEAYWDSLANTIYVPYYLTDSPLESMEHSFNSVKKYGSKMLVVCIPKWDEKHFKLRSVQMAYAPETDAKWYEAIKIPWNDVETKNQMIEVYREKDLGKLVNKYFSEQQKEFLQARSFKDKVSGLQSPSKKIGFDIGAGKS